MTDQDRTDLDHLFDEARRLRPVPSQDLMARILADADAVSRDRAAALRQTSSDVSPPRRSGWLIAMAEALGGWPALGGLATCAVLGVGLGAAQPAGLSSLTASIWGETVIVTLGVDDDPLSLLEG